jgi:hypothetical protein
MPTKYIEIDSTFRNRNDSDNTGPSEFGVRTQQQDDRRVTIDDSISDQVILAKWRKADFSIRTTDAPSAFATRIASHGVQLKPILETLPDGSDLYIGHGDELHLTSMLSQSSAYNGILQPDYNYYWGASVSSITAGVVDTGKILEYRYIGNNECIVRVDPPIRIDESSAIEFSDPSLGYGSGETGGKSNAWEFVPGGPPITSYIGSTLYIYSQGVDSSESNPIKYTVTNHDKDRNLIEINNGRNKNVIGNTDTFILRKEEIQISSLRNRSFFNYFGTSAFTGTTPDYLSNFTFQGDEDISGISVHSFVEISKPVEYGHILTSRVSETQFYMSVAGDPSASSTDDAYNGCTCRFIMDKGDPDYDYVSEDRLITDYVGAARQITIDEGLNNTLSDYSTAAGTVLLMIFPPVENREITKIHDYAFTSYPLTLAAASIGITGTNKLNLLDYTVNPADASYFDEINWTDANGVNIYPYTSSASLGNIDADVIFGASNMISGSSGPLKDKFICWNDGGTYKYGWVTDHIVQFEDNRTGRRYKYNYLVIDTDLGGKIGVVTEGGATPNLIIKMVDLSTPFTRNPYAKHSIDTKLNMYNVIQTDGDNVRRMILPQQVTDYKYRMKLVNISLPNKPLSCSKGGYITEYPYVYVKIRTRNNNNKESNGSFYSMNPNYRQKDFRVVIDNVVDDIVTSHVCLRSSDMVIEEFVLERDDEIYFAVFMPNGELFQTIEPDLLSPYRPNPTLQISAVIELESHES